MTLSDSLEANIQRKQKRNKRDREKMWQHYLGLTYHGGEWAITTTDSNTKTCEKLGLCVLMSVSQCVGVWEFVCGCGVCEYVSVCECVCVLWYPKLLLGSH